MAKSTGNRWGEGTRAYERWRGNEWGDNAQDEGDGKDVKSDQNPWPSDLNTGANESYLSVIEKAIIFEYNKLRHDPARYAREVLVPMRKMFNGKTITLPSPLGRFTTGEGIAVLEETIKDLTENYAPKAPIQKLQPLKGLYLSANDHVKDQSATGGMGHDGSDGSTEKTRPLRYCGHLSDPEGLHFGENILYGIVCDYAKWTVAILIIDDNVFPRHHRTTALEPRWKWIGIKNGTHPNPMAKKMSVHDFGYNIFEK